jgi:POT family proton-dependent oligopeptide transporter
MALGLVMMSLSMVIMMAAARSENQHSEMPCTSPLPPGMTNEKHQLLHNEDGEKKVANAGRLTYDDKGKKLVLNGVLDKNVCDDVIETSAPEDFHKKIEKLQKDAATIDNDKVKSAEVTLDSIPPGFEWRFTGLKKSVVEWNPAAKKLIAHQPLDLKEIKGMLLAAGQPEFRTTMLKLYVKSTEFRVSLWWLFWSFMLATLGELCLSPVGLSMVSKLAPARFATMMMGMWLIISAFGNFAAGAMGEIWGTIEPIDFFFLITVIVGASALVLFLLVQGLKAILHGVK